MQAKFYLVVHSFAFAGTITLKEKRAEDVIQVPLDADILGQLAELKPITEAIVRDLQVVPSPDEQREMVRNQVKLVDAGRKLWDISSEVVPLKSCLVEKKWETCPDGTPIGFVVSRAGTDLWVNPAFRDPVAGILGYSRMVVAIQIVGKRS
jgi:hypothetical protein